MRQGRLGDTAVTVDSEVILQTVTLKYFCRLSQKSTVLVSRKSDDMRFEYSGDAYHE